MKVLGLVAAKENSNRFPGKNIHLVNNEPLFYHSVKSLINSQLIDDVYVVTNSVTIKNYCDEKNINIIWRSKNATRDEDKLISILRYAYYSLDIEYDIIVSVMANCPQNSLEDVEKGIKLMQENNLKEVRSFDRKGIENGIIILNKEIIQDNRDISYYLGGIITNGKEIHYKEDLI